MLGLSDQLVGLRFGQVDIVSWLGLEKWEWCNYRLAELSKIPPRSDASSARILHHTLAGGDDEDMFEIYDEGRDQRLE